MFINPINSSNSKHRVSNSNFYRKYYKANSNQQNKLANNTAVSFKAGRRYALITSSNYAVSNFEHNLAHNLGIKPIEPQVSQFANSETYACLPENIKKIADNTAVIIQTLSKSVNNSIMELLFKVDAAHRAGIDNVVAVMPHMPYSRGERKVKEGESVPLKVVSDMMQSVGVKHCIVGDIHSESSLASANGGLVMHNIPSDRAVYRHFADKGFLPETTVVVSPDIGGVKRADNVASRFGCDTAAIHKVRPGHNQSVAKHLFGNVEDKDVIIVDDMIDTAGTITKAAKMVKDNGAKKVYIAAGHGLFNGKAVENLNNAPIDGVVVTNTVNVSEETTRAINNFEQIDVSDSFAEKIKQLLGIEKITV